MKPGSARAADMRFEATGGNTNASAAVPWVTLANHGDDGQNVLFYDGHVTFADTVYASDNPTDNIFVVNHGIVTNRIGGDLDSVIVRSHCDPLIPSWSGNGNLPWRTSNTYE